MPAGNPPAGICSMAGCMPSLAISARNIRKSYGATVALDDASFSVEPGTVHALFGGRTWLAG